MTPGEREAIDRLDAYLDAVVLGHPIPGERGHPELHEVRDCLRHLGQAPDPTPAFAGELWANLMQTVSNPSGLADVLPPPNGRAPVAGAGDAQVTPGARHRRRLGVAHLATAAVLLLSLALNLLAFGLGPLRGGDPAVHLPALPAASEADPVAFAWLTRGAPNRMPLTDPYHLAIDPDGNLWIPEPWLNQIEIFAPDGTFREAWGTQGRDVGQFNLFNVGSRHRAGGGAIAFDLTGTFYVLDPGNFRIQKFASDRRFLTAWGSKGREDGQFVDPVDVTVDPHGRVYVLDAGRQDVQVFDAQGQFLAKWGDGGTEAGQFRAPSGIAVDADGHLVVADTGNQRLQMFTADGQVLAVWGGIGTDAGAVRTPADVAVDADGRVFVTDAATNQVVILGDDGQTLAAWGELGSEPGQFVGPTGIALSATGSVYVAERGNNRVQAFRLLPPFVP